MNIPIAALRQHLGILGTTGSGKSYAARGRIEELLDEGPELPRMLIIDPKGDWWGLRLKADGKTPAYPFTIIGGQHADEGLRLDPDEPHPMAAPLGKTIATTDSRVILDLSDLPSGKMRAFVATLLQEIYHHNRNPLYLIVDEADEFAPQAPKGEAAVALAAMERIWKRGRQRGIRGWMISQRPASIHKDVLGMVQTLIAMKLVLPHDRKAIKEWMDGQATTGGKTAEEMVKTLPSLKLGTGWVWSPGIGLLDQCAFAKIRTFDSMRTPEDGDVAAGVTLPPIDSSAVATALSAAVKEKKDNDPKQLKAKIAELEGKLATKPVAAPAVRLDIEAIREQAFQDGQVDAIGRAREAWVPIVEDIERLAKGLENVRTKAFEAVKFGVDWIGDGMKRDTHQGGATRAEVCSGLDREDVQPVNRKGSPGSEQPKTRTPAPPHTRGGSPGESAPGGGTKLSGPAETVATAIAWWMSIGIDRPTRTQVALVAGYPPGGSSMRGALAELAKEGRIDYPSSETVELTAKARPFVTRPARPTLQDLHQRIEDKLTGPARLIFEHLLVGSHNEKHRDTIAKLAGYPPGGSSMRGALAELSNMGLIEYPSKTTVKLVASVVFPEGLR